MAKDLSIAECVQIACVLEATARKPGNVSRYHDFADMTYLDFVVSAIAIGPVFERAGQLGVGRTVLEAVKATRRLVRVNTNLGIVLLLAPLAVARAVSTRAKGWSIERIARTVVDIREPMAASEADTMASAISTSMSVKPATACRPVRGACPDANVLERGDRDNLDTSRQPIDPYLIAGAQAGERNGSAAGHSGTEEIDAGSGGALIATRRQQGLEMDVGRQLHHPSGRARAHRSAQGVHLGDDLAAAPHGGVAVGLEQRGGLDRVGLEPGARGCARKRRQDDRRQTRDDRQHAHDLEKGEALLGGATVSASS